MKKPKTLKIGKVILQIKNMQCQSCIYLVIDILKMLNIEFAVVTIGGIELNKDLSAQQYQLLNESLLLKGFEIDNTRNSKITEDVKHEIYLMINSNKEINITNLAEYISEKLGYSKNYISSIFKKTTLGTMLKFYNIERLKKVKVMLLDNDSDLGGIAFKLGFSSVQYLCRFFKRNTKNTTHFFLLKNKNRKRNSSKD